MLIALVNGERTEATPRTSGICQECDEGVKAKCGLIKIWHWAHAPGTKCERARYGMTEWHLGWLRSFPKEKIEIALTVDGKKHIADVIQGKTVLEFQRKMMPPDKMLEREHFWKKAGYQFHWIFDGREAYDSDRFSITSKMKGNADKPYWKFCWKMAPTRNLGCAFPWSIDIGNGRIFEIRKLHSDRRPFCGWGYLKWNASISQL